VNTSRPALASCNCCIFPCPAAGTLQRPEGSDGDDERDIDIPAVASQDQWWDVQYAAEHKDALGDFDGWDFDADGALAGHGVVISPPLRTEHALPRNDTRVEREERPDAVDMAGVAAKVICFPAP